MMVNSNVGSSLLRVRVSEAILATPVFNGATSGWYRDIPSGKRVIASPYSRALNVSPHDDDWGELRDGDAGGTSMSFWKDAVLSIFAPK